MMLMRSQASNVRGAPQGLSLKDEFASHQLVGRVMAYQGYDA